MISCAQMALVTEEVCDLAGVFEEYKRKRDIVYAQFKDHYQLQKPEGAFYAYIKIPDGRDGFVDELTDHKFLVVPGKVLSNRDDHFRLSFAVDDRVLEKGIEILKSVV